MIRRSLAALYGPRLRRWCIQEPRAIHETVAVKLREPLSLQSTEKPPLSACFISRSRLSRQLS